MKREKSIVIMSILMLTFLIINIVPKNQIIMSEKNYDNGVQPRSSAALSIFFGTNSTNATAINADEYYETSQVATLYAKIQLIAGFIYFFDTENTNILCLYRDSGFSDEIKSSLEHSSQTFDFDDHIYISFAPKISGFFYFNFTFSNLGSCYVGVFKASTYSTSDLQEGITLQSNNDDWGGCAIYFTAPDATNCVEADQIELYLRQVFLWEQIDLNSDQAYNGSEMDIEEYYPEDPVASKFQESMLINPGKGFLVMVREEIEIKIELSLCFPPVVIIIVLSIIGAIGVIGFIIYKKKNSSYGRYIGNRSTPSSSKGSGFRCKDCGATTDTKQTAEYLRETLGYSASAFMNISAPTKCGNCGSKSIKKIY